MSETPNNLRVSVLVLNALESAIHVLEERDDAWAFRDRIAVLRTHLERLKAAAPPSPGDVTGPTPTEDEPYQRVAAVVGDDLAALRACAEAWEPDVRLLGNVRASTIAALCIELEQFRTRNVSRGDVTGTPAPLWSFARTCVAEGYALCNEHANRRGVTYERASAEMDALAVRLSDERMSRPDLTGETPPASAVKTTPDVYSVDYNPSTREWHFTPVRAADALQSVVPAYRLRQIAADIARVAHYLIDGETKRDAAIELVGIAHRLNALDVKPLTDDAMASLTRKAGRLVNADAGGGPPPETTREGR